MRLGLLTAALAILAAQASADGYHTRDMGAGGSGEECMERAEAAIRAYAAEPGNSDGGTIINSGDWSVQGFDLLPGDVDVQIACPYRNNVASIVLAISHSRGSHDERAAVIDGITEHWNAYEEHQGRPSK